MKQMNNVDNAEETIVEKYRIDKATSSENVQTQRAKDATYQADKW